MENQSSILNVETTESFVRKSTLLPSLQRLGSETQKTKDAINPESRDRVTDYMLAVFKPVCILMHRALNSIRKRSKY